MQKGLVKSSESLLWNFCHFGRLVGICISTVTLMSTLIAWTEL